jgi:hypothetical protein
MMTELEEDDPPMRHRPLMYNEMRGYGCFNDKAKKCDVLCLTCDWQRKLFVVLGVSFAIVVIVTGIAVRAAQGDNSR